MSNRLHSSAWALALASAVMTGCGGGGDDSPSTPSGGGGTTSTLSPVDVASVVQLNAAEDGANQAVQVAKAEATTVASASWGTSAAAPASSSLHALSYTPSAVMPQAANTTPCFTDPKTGETGSLSTETTSSADNSTTKTTTVWTHCNGVSTAALRYFRDGFNTITMTTEAAPTTDAPSAFKTIVDSVYDVTDTWIASPLVGSDITRQRKFFGARHCVISGGVSQCSTQVDKAVVVDVSGVTTTDTVTHIGSATVDTRSDDASKSLRVVYTDWHENQTTGETSGTAVVTDSQGTVAHVQATYTNGTVTYTVVLTKGSSNGTYVFTN